jgi:hypothetical protein
VHVLDRAKAGGGENVERPCARPEEKDFQHLRQALRGSLEVPVALEKCDYFRIQTDRSTSFFVLFL